MKESAHPEQRLEGCSGFLDESKVNVTTGADLLARIEKENNVRPYSAVLHFFLAEEGDTLESVRIKLDSDGFCHTPQSVAGRLAYGLRSSPLFKVGSQALVFLETSTKPIAVIIRRRASNEKLYADLSPTKVKAGTIIAAPRKGSVHFCEP